MTKQHKLQNITAFAVNINHYHCATILKIVCTIDTGQIDAFLKHI